MRNTNNEHPPSGVLRRASSIENAFSLIEVLIATMLVGLAIVALVAANSSFTKANAVGTELSTAEFLIEQIRERTVLVDYAGLYAFDGASFSPPISAGGDVLNHFAAFSQQVTVENVDAANFEQVVGDGSSDFIRVTIKVFLNSREIGSTSWIRADIGN